jgi:amino acid transporter
MIVDRDTKIVMSWLKQFVVDLVINFRNASFIELMIFFTTIGIFSIKLFLTTTNSLTVLLSFLIILFTTLLGSVCIAFLRCERRKWMRTGSLIIIVSALILAYIDFFGFFANTETIGALKILQQLAYITFIGATFYMIKGRRKFERFLQDDRNLK